MKSKINFAIQIITICLSLSIIILPQDKQQEHYLLAKNFILKNRIETQRSFIMPKVNVDTRKWAKEIEDILQSDTLKYTIRTINKIKSFETFLLQDLTNLRLHLYYSQFYVYNTENKYYGYDEIDSDNIGQYINDYVLDYATVEDFNKVIDLYNEVYFFPMKSVDDSIVFFDSNNLIEFKELNGIVKFDELLKFIKADNTTYQHRVYKKYIDNNFIEYYQVTYFFNNCAFNIEQNLLLRLRAN